MATLRKAGAGSLRGGRGCDDDAPRGGARRRSVPRVALAAAALMMLAGAGVGTALHACSDLAWHSVTVFSRCSSAAVVQSRSAACAAGATGQGQLCCLRCTRSQTGLVTSVLAWVQAWSASCNCLVLACTGQGMNMLVRIRLRLEL